MSGYNYSFQMSPGRGLLSTLVNSSIFFYLPQGFTSGEGSSRAPGTVHETRPLFQRIINEEDGETPVRIQEPYRPYPKFSEYTDRLRG